MTVELKNWKVGVHMDPAFVKMACEDMERYGELA